MPAQTKPLPTRAEAARPDTRRVQGHGQEVPGLDAKLRARTPPGGVSLGSQTAHALGSTGTDSRRPLSGLDAEGVNSLRSWQGPHAGGCDCGAGNSGCRCDS